MIEKIKILLILSMIVYLLNACSYPKDIFEEDKQLRTSQPTYSVQNLGTIPELTPKQQAAFDALNKLQVSTDERNRLYSTFAGIFQNCYPPDTSLTISQSELLKAMKQFVTFNCKNLTTEERDTLAATSILAQKEYTLSLCLGNSTNINYKNGPPMSGTWVLTSVLGRRDVIIVW